ncbi:helix-turn-helix transcriptional regulator [Loktanella sp. SALINAS62]|uniref:helix-turn-helix transcriptional regulator n=1 Tax=Loktanella sp. SALINAS62 TaxID=2706124 RepID=UPI001B8B3C94|nr:helix-turn-helix transcriptional regulator [Loktanella sp. SALINAS62]MBS1301764.1 helix-turn-helix transcriptional regulator [Loktanella sp. SALINAS62]
MSRYWFIGSLVVTGVAALKTVLVTSFVLTADQVDMATIGGLFVLFAAMTAGAGYIGVTQLRGYMMDQRRKRVAPGAGEPVAKETIIARCAQDWALSQAEADVAIFVAKGFSNSEIAEMRGCAISTVKSQLGAIYTKSGLGSRYQLMAFVTDEVCSMAKVADTLRPAARLETRKVLPLVGRARRSAAVAQSDTPQQRIAG